jgi:hypothetical protein
MPQPPEELPDSGLDALLAEAKHRGRQRRTRRRAMMAGAGAVILLGLVSGAFAVVRGGRTEVHVIAPPTRQAVTQTATAAASPTASATPSAAAVQGVPGLQPVDPGALAVGPNGNLFVADNAQNEILERFPDGLFSLVAGTGKPGFSGDGGPANRAALNGPEGMAFGPDGTLYVADTQNNRVRAISPAGIITTVVGGGTPNCSALIGTGTRALSAGLSQPADVAIGPGGRLYVAADCNNEILRLDANGTVTEIAGEIAKQGVAGVGGPATQASPDGPHALAFDRAGDLYVFGSNDKSLLVITPAGTLTAPMGTGNFYPEGDGGIAERPDGSDIAMDQQSLVTLLPSGIAPLVDFATLGPAAVDGIANFLPSGLAAGSDGTIYTDTNPDAAKAQQSAIVAIPPGASPRVIWGPSPPPALPAIPSPARPTLANVALGADGLGVVSVNELETAAVHTMTQILGPPTGYAPGACIGSTEVEWSDLSLEFQGGFLQGYRYLRGGFGQIGSLNPPPTGPAVPLFTTAGGATLGMTLAQVQPLYPASDFTMEHGGTIQVRGSSGTLSLEFDSNDPTTRLGEIKGGQPCGDV